MGGLPEASPTIQAIVTGVCGFGAIGYFLWQVFSRIKVDDRRAELDKEQKDDRSSLRARNKELEHKVAELHNRLLEVSMVSSGASACLTSMDQQLRQYEQKVKDLEAEISLIENAVNDCEAKGEKYRLALAMTQGFLGECANCRNTKSYALLVNEIPKLLEANTQSESIGTNWINTGP